MIKKIVLITLSGLLMTSCVSSKVYKDLEGKYASLKRKNRKTQDKLVALQKVSDADKKALEQLESEYQKLKAERDDFEGKYNAAQANYNNIKDSYDALEKNSSAAIAANSKKNRELLSQLEEKERALAQERSRLDKLQSDLEARSKRVNELEGLIAAKDAKMQALKSAISKALRNFEGKGLTVEERNGKVYISMENKLLFESGSWAVGTQGKKAVKQLGSVLAQNTDIAVLIEGHTDDDPYTGNAQLSGNWDLSTKRATAIVNILLENKQIDAQNLTAAGRGEFAPVASNETNEGKSKNRRIEVILTPKLDEISKLLNDI
ncbi:cell envelope biogenesis protein OmpA [Aquimarina sp. AD10]|uniref:OmpA/MotB family protein n=1 Tax=Aquimarina sp. AD10 TaxID=1714849 RepID=UPI000E516A62|nr:OmpA family protein [Aquimarina sp. AD10]AXT62104.1 cell envelope biogenesis protein OmpA [Aquimarina sp. AD10]RKM99908.1 cell envelope biogenesis protein OmpA [Aquimarina sp. AD10]